MIWNPYLILSSCIFQLYTCNMARIDRFCKAKPAIMRYLYPLVALAALFKKTSHINNLNEPLGNSLHNPTLAIKDFTNLRFQVL